MRPRSGDYCGHTPPPPATTPPKLPYNFTGNISCNYSANYVQQQEMKPISSSYSCFRFLSSNAASIVAVDEQITLSPDLQSAKLFYTAKELCDRHTLGNSYAVQPVPGRRRRRRHRHRVCLSLTRCASAGAFSTCDTRNYTYA